MVVVHHFFREEKRDRIFSPDCRSLKNILQIEHLVVVGQIGGDTGENEPQFEKFNVANGLPKLENVGNSQAQCCQYIESWH